MPCRPTRGQFRTLWTRIGPAYRLFADLQRWLERLGYPRDDPYFSAVARAETAIHSVMISSHYLSCESGVGGANQHHEPDPNLWLGEGI
jgi:hypothetical protein